MVMEMFCFDFIEVSILVVILSIHLCKMLPLGKLGKVHGTSLNYFSTLMPVNNYFEIKRLIFLKRHFTSYSNFLNNKI